MSATDYYINAVARRVVLSGSAGVGPYSFSFEILANTDVAVYKDSTLLTLTTDYTVTINTNGTGYVTLVVAATGANIITIVGAKDVERVTDFVTAGDLQANSLNDQLDSQIIFIQQVDDKADRSIHFPVYDSTSLTTVLPAAASRANKAVVFDASGNVGVSTDDYVDQATATAASAAAAAASAATATTQAGNAATSAAAATTNGAAQVTLAAAQVTLASTQATNAANSASAAAASAAALPNAASIGAGKVPQSNGTTWTGTTVGVGDMLKSDNLSGLASNATARTNLGLGTGALLVTDTDTTLAANSDSNVATQKAVKTYASNASNLSSGTLAAARLPTAAPKTTAVVTSSSDVSLSQAPTQANVGSTFSLTIPTSGLIQLEFMGRFLNDASATARSLILGIRIGSTNYWPTVDANGSTGYTFTLGIPATANYYLDVKSGGVGASDATNASGYFSPRPVWLGIEALGIPTGAQTVQVIAAILSPSGSATLKGTTTTTKIFVTTFDHT